MSGKLSIQQNGDNSACCVNPWGQQKQKKQQDIDEEALNDIDLAKEMNKLSFEERERISEDVHGVAAVVEETPEMVERSIAELDEAISKVPTRKRKAYSKALFLRPSFQTDRKFKLQFLRAEEFDAAKAAERMAMYFQQKLDLFGEEKLGKTLTLDDLTENDPKEDNLYPMKVGYMMVLPTPDRSGRPIIFNDGTKLDYSKMTVDSILRCYWYLLVSCYEDEVAQKKGTCTVIRFSGHRRSISKSAELARRAAYNSRCAPGRNSSLHICYDDPRMNVVINVIRFRAGQFTRVRTRAHLGSEVENDYKLMTFGISCAGLLQRIKTGDTFFADKYIQTCRIRDRRIIEEEEQEEARTTLILYPKPKDVLIGRGKSYRGLPGNALWEAAMQHAFEQFRTSSTKFEKTCISMEVIKSVQDTGARFLKRDPDGWRVLDDVIARQKTAIAFRNHGKTFLSTACLAQGMQTYPQYLDVPTSSCHVAKRPRMDDESIG